MGYHEYYYIKYTNYINNNNINTNRERIMSKGLKTTTLKLTKLNTNNKITNY